MLASRSAATAQEKFALLNCRRLPGRLNTSEAALLLGFQRARHCAVDCGKVAGATGKTCAERSEVFRCNGHRGPGIRFGLALVCYKTAGETLASKESAKASACEIGCSIRCSQTGKRLEEDRQATDDSASYEKRNEGVDERTLCSTRRVLLADSFSGNIAGFLPPPDLRQYF
jgi:hypothetical protein